jgi:hypothetical protein
MRRTTVLLASLSFAGAACGPNSGPPEAASEPPTVEGSASTPVPATDTVAETEAAPVTATLPTVIRTPKGVVPDGVCNDPTPVTTVAFGPMGTFLRVDGDEFFEGVIQARPDIACPGDLVEFVVSIANRSAEPRSFRTTKGLLLHTGGPEKWQLAPMPGGEIGPGEVWTTTVTATIPPTRAGSHDLSAGYNVFGEITVLDALTARES